MRCDKTFSVRPRPGRNREHMPAAFESHDMSFPAEPLFGVQ